MVQSEIHIEPSSESSEYEEEPKPELADCAMQTEFKPEKTVKVDAVIQTDDKI